MLDDRVLVSQDSHQPPIVARRRWGVTILLLMGAILWVLWLPTTPRFTWRLLGAPMSVVVWDAILQGAIVLFALALAFLPPVRAAMNRVANHLRHPTPFQRPVIAIAVALSSALYLYASAILQQRILLPLWHDEQQYRLQTSIFATGHLWLPAHPLAEFFESFYVFTKPVYAVMYFPGTALINVPGVWLGLPYWAVPLTIAALIAALLYLVITELLDGAAGLLAVLLLLALSPFRWLAMVEMSHPVALLMSLVMFWAWLSWRQSPRIGWFLLAGAAAGWCAVTRPIDAMCAIAPVAIGWLIDLLHRGSARRKVVPILVAFVGALPFIALQLIFDKGVTGHLLQSPMGLYDRTYFQISGLGFHKPSSTFRPPTDLPQFQIFYYGLWRPELDAYTPKAAIRQAWRQRLPTVAGTVLPSSLLLVLLPAGVLGLSDRRRLAVFLVMPLFLAVMFFYFSFLAHYCTIFFPAAILLVLLGARAVGRAWPHEAVSSFLALSLIGLSLLALPEINRRPTESTSRMALMEMNYTAIPEAVEKPAIVLFTFDVNNPSSVHEEPVYNWDVAWPDDAPIIRAHDLGDRENVKLFRYYAQKQPDRHVYLFDRATRALKPLGRVSRLASKSREK